MPSMKNRKQLPKRAGVKRQSAQTVLHKLVKKELQAIARRDKKTLSYVLYDIVYLYFGLEVSNHEVKVIRRHVQSRVIPFKKRRAS
jgi:hypothetical protein